MKQQSTVGRLLGFASQCKGKMTVSVVLGVIGVLLGMVPYYVMIQLAQMLYHHTATAEKLAFWIGCILVAELLKFLFSTKSMLLAHDSAYSIMETIRQQLTEKMMRVPLGVISDTSSGHLKVLVVDTVEKLEKPLAHMLPEITANVLTPLFIIIYLFYLDYRLALAALVTIPIGIICMMGQMKDYETRSKTYMDACANMESRLVEYVNGIQVIKTFNQSSKCFGQYADAVRHYHDTTVAWWKTSMLFSALGGTIITSTLIGTLPVGTYLLMTDRIPFEIFIAGLALSVGIAGPIMQATTYVDLFAIVDASVKQIAEFLSLEELDYGQERAELENGDLALEKVSFSYGETEVLHDVSLRLGAHQMTAIVGPSGGGKSTIAKLLAGFYHPQKGRVTLGGVDLRALSFEQLMETVSFVSQDSFLFDMSILENIRVGKRDASDEEVIAAAKAAGCHDFIMQLPQGYATQVGDVGKLLSGGERQRITIARAMLKPAQTIILDEATAYVDPENEQLIQAAIGRLVKDKTLIVIAHRLSTIVHADQIIVIEQGRCVAKGTQQSLLEDCALYQRMWNQHVAGRDGLTGETQEVQHA